MSKKKLIQKRLKKGRFYLVYDGSDSGHPGMIYWKNDNKNVYLCLTTGTTYNKNLIQLDHPTDSQTAISYANKRPFYGKRKDFGKKEMLDMRFNKEDKKNYLRKISEAEPRYSKNINRKDKRYLMRIRKKKKIKY